MDASKLIANQAVYVIILAMVILTICLSNSLWFLLLWNANCLPKPGNCDLNHHPNQFLINFFLHPLYCDQCLRLSGTVISYHGFLDFHCHFPGLFSVGHHNIFNSVHLSYRTYPNDNSYILLNRCVIPNFSCVPAENFTKARTSSTST